MTRLGVVAAGVLAVAFVTGGIADRPPDRPAVTLGGYRVLAADFHTHSSTWSDGSLTPLGLVLEAERQRLDVIAITGHNQVSDSKVGQWFAALIGGPVVLTGQEVISPDHHVIAIGITQVIDGRLPVADEIRAIHDQGGLAIAAHPIRPFWPAFDDEARRTLDGAEVCHPLVLTYPALQDDLTAFKAHTAGAAIGSSDFHGFGRMGACRTYVFASEATPAAVLDAIRARHTVVYALDGQAFGDPELVALAATRPELRDAAIRDAPVTGWDWASRGGAIAGLMLVGLIAGPTPAWLVPLSAFRRRPPSRRA